MRKGRQESKSKSKSKSPQRDHLTRTTGQGKVELTEKELNRVTGGAPTTGSLDAGYKYNIKGE